jgi:hypothetical protein
MKSQEEEDDCRGKPGFEHLEQPLHGMTVLQQLMFSEY